MSNSAHQHVGSRRISRTRLSTHPHWFACYTKGRHEKSVARLLAARGFESYVPLRVEKRQWSDRIKDVAMPLFPNYVFARFTWSLLYRVVQIPGLVSVVQQTELPAPIPDRVIKQVRMVMEKAGTHEVWAEHVSRLTTGQPVRVIGGAFKGVEATVVQLRGKSRVMIRLPEFEQGLTFVVSSEHLRPTD